MWDGCSSRGKCALGMWLKAGGDELSVGPGQRDRGRTHPWAEGTGAREFQEVSKPMPGMWEAVRESGPESGAPSSGWANFLGKGEPLWDLAGK